VERDLENFIKLKQKQEMQKKLLRKKGDFYGTSQICRDLTKFLKNNSNNLVPQFESSHKKYNT
jgi:hypothetical protein